MAIPSLPARASTDWYAYAQGLDTAARGAAVAADVATAGTPTGDALRAAYGTPGLYQDSLRPFRAALAGARVGVTDVRIVAQGDSFTFGQSVTSPWTNHWAKRLAELIGARTGLPTGIGPIGLAQQLFNTTNPQVTLGTGWSVFGTNTAYGMGMVTAAVGTAASVDVAFTETVDGANITWQTGGGNTGDLVYSWDGGARTTIANPGGGYGLTATYIGAPSRGAHTLHLWQAATGFSSYYNTVEPQDSQQCKIRWFASGITGKTSADLAAAFNTTGTLTPGGFLNATHCDLFLLGIGDNDQMQVQGAVTTSTFTGNLQSILTQVRGLARPMSTVYWGPPPSQNESTWTPRLSDFMDAADAWGDTQHVPVVRLDKRFGSYTAGSALGLYADSVHTNAAGEFEIAGALTDVLLAPLPPAAN